MQMNPLLKTKSFKEIVFSPILIFAIFAVFMFIMFSRVPLMPGDDLIVAEMHLKYSLPDYMAYRFNTWSGRVFGDSMNYWFAGEFYFLWKWLCTGMIVIASFTIYKWVTWKKEMSLARKCLLAALCCFGFGIINSNILSPAVFWVTGALYYLIPFAMGVVVFTPFVFSLKDASYKPKNWMKVISIIFAIFIAFTQEQVALCLVAAAAVTLIYLFIKNRKINVFLLILTLVTAVCIAISMTAPGESLRFAANVGTFPLFQLMELKQRLAVMAHFTMNTLINQTYLPLMFLWFATGWMLFKKTEKKALKTLAVISLAVSAIMFLRMVNPVDSNVFGSYTQTFQQMFTFNYLSPQSLQSASQIVPYVFWGVSLLLIPVNIWFIWGKSERSFFYTLVYIAAIASVVVMTFTPVLYFSGARTGFLPNMLFLILLYFMIAYFKQLKGLAGLIILIAVIKLAVLFSMWNTTGFTLWYGVLDTSSIPFKVTN
jgi:hypothetical protein